MWAASLVGDASFTVIRGVGPGSLFGSSDGTAAMGPKLPKIADDPEYRMPDNDKKRLDVLLLGVRGDGDSANGSMLTDTIILLSLDTGTGRASMTSVPRDLTVRVTDERTEKINAVYAHYGLGGTKKMFSRILGIGIDNVVLVDFSAFQSVVDALGGITITLDRPFEESQQWAGTASESYSFALPAGPNTLTGEQALYYVRSRYSTSDFDRARRQQQVLMAIKAKAEGLDLLSDPIRALELVTTVRKHMETDLNIFDLGTIRDLMAQSGQLDRIRRYQLTTENLLYETKIDGIYELLPRDGTLAHIKEFFRTVLDEHPVMSVPTPSQSPSPSTEVPAA
jgi:LCP family protein required for cell wall assembly